MQARGSPAGLTRQLSSPEPVTRANPNAPAPLAELLTFETASPASALIDVSGGKNPWWLEYGTVLDPVQGLPMVGMLPDRHHEVSGGAPLWVRGRDRASASAGLPDPAPARNRGRATRPPP